MQKDFDISGLSVFIAIPVNRDFPWQTTRSLIETTALLKGADIPYQYQFLTQGSQIDFNRSHLAWQFLQSKHNRLFWIDSDMSWDAESFLRILALSTVLPVVGATYPVKQGPGRSFQLDITSEEQEANEYGCLEVKGMGLGFTCVQREVMEKLSAQSPKFVRDKEVQTMMFRTGLGPDWIHRSEDMHFFKDCRDMGYKVWLDPMIELGHIGGYEYRGRLLDALVKVDDRGELPKTFTFPADVDGWLTEAEGAALANFAQGKAVLEIGSYKGRSTICMAQTAKSVCSVDPFDARNVGEPAHTIREFYENIGRYGVFDRVKAHVGLSGHVPLEGQFDLAFIDGDHDYEAVLKDIAWCESMIAPGGLLAFHDYFLGTKNEDFFGVDRAVKEYVKRGARILRRVDSLILVKPPTPTVAV